MKFFAVVDHNGMFLYSGRKETNVITGKEHEYTDDVVDFLPPTRDSKGNLIALGKGNGWFLNEKKTAFVQNTIPAPRRRPHDDHPSESNTRPHPDSQTQSNTQTPSSS